MGAGPRIDPSDAFARSILAEHGAALTKYIRRLGVPVRDVEDVLQEVVQAACAAVASYDPDRATLRQWLFGIAFRQVGHWWRRAHNRHEKLWLHEPSSRVHDDAADPEARLHTCCREALLHEFLAQLPEQQREVLVRYELQEEVMPKIAAELGLNENTARARCSAGREHLISVVQRWRAQQRARGRDDVPVVLLPFLGAEELASRRPRDPAPRSSWSARASGARNFAASLLTLALASLIPGDAARQVLGFSAAVDAETASIAPPGLAARGPEPGGDSEPAVASPAPAALALVPTAPTPAATTPAVRAPAAQQPDSQAELAAESRLINSALAAMQRRSPYARRLLEQHARKFPDGALADTRKQLMRELNRE